MLYSPLVSPGSYLIVEDNNLDGISMYPECGPVAFAAVETFLLKNSHDRRDIFREAFVLPWNPGGRLQRTE